MPVDQKIIIGIHGLAKKPAEEVLTRWWEKAICEGLNHNVPKYKRKNIQPQRLNFSMVYWNGLMGKNRVLAVEQLKQNREHYQSAREGDIQKYEARILDEKWIKARDLLGDITEVMINFTRGEVSRKVMKKGLKDLYRYYNIPKLKLVLQNCLKQELIAHADKRIMLISHSMGTIIAYDVLRQLAEQRKDFVIEHFVTMGSPLGLPFITERIREDGKPPIPKNIKRWTNFADMRDPVCADPNLADDYKKNKSGISIADQLVLNDWPHDKLSHKSYGYLRTPEVSKVIAAFL